mmetsp:Transcript_82437/g.163581  ORF Transcript_82437/g.163581 Transcript_82437/m.163581 type:complete len:418 (-) Transcript_82437:65-1318(-)|eukprot:CAMPEP_0172918670 /NCGR_PEP_ID=MMETSP1075-20121228/200633_1 /TAXON_ID=2916 /ORGANISM="Ceratium fusus, Strain PA161109" /LENGTH=417 /DNA_ID=CAMNT_0013778375 /DNA_START=177 /DNA_END=1430 /DNA_ORIENTATION=-
MEEEEPDAQPEGILGLVPIDQPADAMAVAGGGAASSESNKRARVDDARRIPAGVQVDEWDPLVKRVVGTSLPPYVFQRLKEKQKSFAEDVEKLVAARAKHETLQHKVRELEAGRLPKGEKEFIVKKPSPGSSGIVKEDSVYSIAFNRNTSLQDAKKQAYMFHMQLQRRIDMWIKEKEVDVIEEKTDFNIFTNECMAIGTQHGQVVTTKIKLRNVPVDLVNPQSTVNFEKASQLYVQTVNKVAEKQQQTDASNDQREKNRNAVKKSVLEADPSKKLANAIDQRINMKLNKTKRKAKGFVIDHVGIQSGTDVDLCVRDVENVRQTGNQHPKNDRAGASLPPPARPATTNRWTTTPSTQSAGKGTRPTKGTGKGKGKNKGKGSTTTNNPTRSKGKGKGKGKSKTTGKGKGKTHGYQWVKA